jgi:DNA-binding GntR family transcriptional regulator
MLVRSMDSPAGAPGSRDGQNVALIHERLRDQIIRGDIQPGAVMSQVVLGEQLGVGRTPLREALRILQAEGLVVGEPNRRVRVAELTGPDAEELYIMRVTLETAAVRLTVPHLTSRHIAEMEGYMAQMNHYGRDRDWAALCGPHRAFHETFIAGAGPRIVDHLTELFDHSERYRLAQVAATEEQWARRQSEHRALIDAAAEGDVELLVKELAAHYVRSAALVLARLDPDRDPERLRATVRSLVPEAEEALDYAATLS